MPSKTSFKKPSKTSNTSNIQQQPQLTSNKLKYQKYEFIVHCTCKRFPKTLNLPPKMYTKLLPLILCLFCRTIEADFCRLKSKTSCVGSIQSYNLLQYNNANNPFSTGYADGFYSSADDFWCGGGTKSCIFYTGFADLDNDGDLDMVLGHNKLTGVEYYTNVAPRADQKPIWQKTTSGGNPLGVKSQLHRLFSQLGLPIGVLT